MNILLSGATGFVGSHFLQAALNRGHHIRAIRRHSLAQLTTKQPKQLEWVEAQINEIEACHLRGIDVVVHFAAAGVSPQKSSWTQMLDINVIGSQRLMTAAIKAGVKRFVAAGTCHEYGESAKLYDKIPVNAALQPLTPYGASKAAGFTLLRTTAIEQAFEFFYGRIFTVYGDGQCGLNFWPSLKKAATDGRDFPMTSGTQISDFIHATQVADHFLAACERNDIDASRPLITNVGSGNAMRLLDFAEREWTALGATGKLLPGSLPDRKDQIPRYVPDLSGLYPSASIAQTVKQ